MSRWTFGRKVAAGFTLVLLLSVVIGVVAVGAIRSGDAAQKEITAHVALLSDTERLRAARSQQTTAIRDYSLTGDRSHLTVEREASAEYTRILAALTRAAPSQTGRTMLEDVAAKNAAYEAQLATAIPAARVPGPAGLINDATRDPRLAASDAVTAFLEHATGSLTAISERATRTADLAADIVAVLTIAAVGLGLLVAYLVTRALSRQIGAAVSQVQTSAADLETASSQQASSAKEEATAMAQITTTMSELLATSRQIADTAQRVSGVAVQAASAARSGEGTVSDAHESVAGIQRQVNLIVEHMLELGGKSQQIGAVLDIVSELAEQTNILAINATIEAAGAGESGARFAVVADEIRNLADRVGGSTKEIRELIEEVRGAVNTTVMATETGSKTVEAGSRQFGAVADSFREIAAQLASTTDAAREIELSTKQQASAVEQINVGVRAVAQTTRETEASASQTRQTAAQLAALSSHLLRMVHPPAHDKVLSAPVP
jgi:methyl-accepting chemotaxis protein